MRMLLFLVTLLSLILFPVQSESPLFADALPSNSELFNEISLDLASGSPILPEPQVDNKNLLSLELEPFGSIPIGSSSDLFKFGGGVSISGFFLPALLRFAGITLESSYFVIPLKPSNFVNTISVTAGPFLRFPIGNRFEIIPYGRFGYYYWFPVKWETSGNNGGGAALGLGLLNTFKITNTFALGVGISYDYYFNLYNGFRVNLTARMDFSLKAKERSIEESKPEEVIPQLLNEKGKGLELRDITLSPLFPVLYKYYDNTPVGTVRIKNFEKKNAEDIKIHFFVERYMDNPMEIGVPINMEPGEDISIELYGLFTDDLMEITEGTKASAKISLTYTMDGKSTTVDYTPVLEIYNRNALTWDDDRKIASFVTAKDPEILGFSKNVMSWIKDVKNPAIDENLQKGMAIFEAVKSYGIYYEIDPATPFTELSGQKTAIDFLQFPRQTLRYTNGDCDDLTSLYTSLLEAVGVETAVITIPGHIYGAFALKATPDEARRTFSRPDELIIIENNVWVPVEITMFQESFEKAWQTGAKEWRENNSREQSRLFPIRESWQLYQAVGFGEGSGVELPDREQVTEAFKNSITTYVEREIYPQEVHIKNQIQQSEDDNKYKNSLGVLYSRYGLYDRAVEAFMEILKVREYKPALINLGNIFYINNDYEIASSYYQRVIEIDDDNKKALLGTARCNHELENYGLVSKIYKQLKTIAPDLAIRFSYLDLRGEEATRAADAAGIKSIVLWEEEQ